jgi:hypothetical protein
MESNRIIIGALLFILIIVGSNYVMFVIARNWAKGGDSRWLTAIKTSLNKPLEGKSNQSMDELRKQIAELEKNKNGE